MAERGRCTVSELRDALDDYIALRRALGFQLRLPARSLRNFVAFVEANQATYITTALAMRWATQPPDAQPATWAWRLGMVRRFASWRLVHVLLGTLAVITLIGHTGLRLGYNLNLLLMLNFLALLLAGSVASGVIGLQRVLPRGRARRTRELSLWLHILLLWPLPALLGLGLAGCAGSTGQPGGDGRVPRRPGAAGRHRPGHGRRPVFSCLPKCISPWPDFPANHPI